MLAIPSAFAAPASAAVPPGFVGVNFDGPLFPVTATGVNLSAQAARMVADGVQTIRAVFDWSYAQPYHHWSDVPSDEMSQFTNVGGVPTRFGELDQLVGLAASHGLTVLPTILYTPSWDGEATEGELEIPKRNDPYASFCAALVRRYGPRGTFWKTHSHGKPIHMWQIWNEPGVQYFWFKRPFEASYAALLHAAHTAIKAADPNAVVVLAGMPNYSWVQLANLFKVRGVNNWFEAVAAHPYTKYPAGVITILQRDRNAMDKAGDARKPLIADELSWPSSAGQTSHNVNFDIGVTEAGQAKRVSQILPLLAADRKRLGLSAFYYYTWASYDTKNANLFSFAGLYWFKPDGTFKAKPAATAFRRSALALEGCRKKGAVATACLK